MPISKSQLKRALTGMGYGRAQREIFKELGAKKLTSKNVGRVIERLAREKKISESAGAAFERRFKHAEKKAQEAKPEISERKPSFLGGLFGRRREPQIAPEKKEVTPEEERKEYLKKVYQEVEERRKAEEEQRKKEAELEKKISEQFK